ncbi:hypothetical protein MG293_014816 [Ovis ammon polii]|uniref:Uncharacterized protein n=1 Tax=Ovis ammon polii TaxID=230172 RepID=A0AAD4U0S1_OVIAM|nr:hypothetical protein MG293_014816 [Ovis ammon polii]
MAHDKRRVANVEVVATVTIKEVVDDTDFSKDRKMFTCSSTDADFERLPDNQEIKIELGYFELYTVYRKVEKVNVFMMGFLMLEPLFQITVKSAGEDKCKQEQCFIARQELNKLITSTVGDM